MAAHRGIDHLVIVCCHAIWMGGATGGQHEREWLIKDFQKGETTAYIDHIKKGLDIVRNDPNALLMFSGGPTKPKETAVSEGGSYMALAQKFIRKDDNTLGGRMFVETVSTDSYQNLLFSIIAFHQVTANYPERITLISHEFKKERFCGFHCEAIKWPLEKFTYLGKDPKRFGMPPADVYAEEARTRDKWRSDLYGCHDTLLAKRVERGWQHEVSLAALANDGYEPEENIRHLLRYNGGPVRTNVFPHPLPWSHTNVADGANGATVGHTTAPRAPHALLFDEGSTFPAANGRVNGATSGGFNRITDIFSDGVMGGATNGGVDGSSRH